MIEIIAIIINTLLILFLMAIHRENVLTKKMQTYIYFINLQDYLYNQKERDYDYQENIILKENPKNKKEMLEQIEQLRKNNLKKMKIRQKIMIDVGLTPQFKKKFSNKASKQIFEDNKDLDPRDIIVGYGGIYGYWD